MQQRNVDVDPIGMWNSFVGTLTRRGKLFALVVFGVILRSRSSRC